MNNSILDEKMEIFTFMDNIYFDSVQQFIDNVDFERKGMLDVDLDEINQEPTIINMDRIKELPNGRWNVEYKEIKFECFFQQKKNKNLYVILSGSRSGILPNFSRWSYYKFMNGSVVNIADPMYRMYDGLRLGWYYGSNNLNLQQVLSDLILEIARLLDVEQRNIVFVGSSGGGMRQ